MQLELFPGYVNTSVDVEIEMNNAGNDNQFEVLLYANANDSARDLVINVNSPEGNVIFTHVNPNEQINVYIDGSTTIKGNLSITGDLLVSGKINHVFTDATMNIQYLIGDLEITYNKSRNLIYLNGKETKNYAEIGKKIVKQLRKYQDDLTFNECKDFFNY